MGVSANGGGGAGGVPRLSPFFPFSATVLRACLEDVVEFPAFVLSEFRPYTSRRM